MKRYFLFSAFALFFSGAVFGQDSGVRFLFVNKVFVPTTRQASFSLPGLKVDCVGGGCSEDFVKENSPLVVELLTKTSRHFHLERDSPFRVRVVSREYFKKMADKFPKKKRFVFFERQVRAVLQRDEHNDGWLVTLPRLSSLEDLFVVWTAIVMASDKDRFGKDFIGNKQAVMIANKILGETQYVSPNALIQ